MTKRVSFTFTGTVTARQEHSAVHLTNPARDALEAAMTENGITDVNVDVMVYRPKTPKAGSAAQ